MSVACTGQKMPNHTNTWSHQTVKILWKKFGKCPTTNETYANSCNMPSRKLNWDHTREAWGHKLSWKRNSWLWVDSNLSVSVFCARRSVPFCIALWLCISLFLSSCVCFLCINRFHQEARISHYGNSVDAARALPNMAEVPPHPRIQTHPFLIMQYGLHPVINYKYGPKPLRNVKSCEPPSTSSARCNTPRAVTPY